MTRKTTNEVNHGSPGRQLARALSAWRDGLLPVRFRLRFRNLLLTFTLSLLPFSLSPGCGLDWTLPHAHFEGVDEQGYVSYWEKIGQADLGDGLVIPVHINFNSHRQSSSATLGKGWMLPLLESHVEPVDENTLHVIMPDGWTFLFLRNGDTDTWRGNAGWIGQTDGARFTITAPCGWRVKFDAGKIHEIDTPKNRTITIKYNGPDPLEADIDNQPFVQVAQNTTTGVAESITIAGQKIAISQAPRPRINTILNKTLLTGFDPALSQLQWPDGQKETFDFTAPKDLAPSLVISKTSQPQRNITWDAATMQIKTDGDWTYHFTTADNVSLLRSNPEGQDELFSANYTTGVTIVQGINGIRTTTSAFVAGPLTGRVRSVTQVVDGVTTMLRKYDYDENGRMTREIMGGMRPREYEFKYDSRGRQVEVDLNNKPFLKKQFDAQGRIIAENYVAGLRNIYSYKNYGVDITTYLGSGKAIFTHLDNIISPFDRFHLATGAVGGATEVTNGEGKQ